MHIQRTTTKAGRVAAYAGAIALVVFGVACGSALDVPNPQAFSDDALNNPIILKNVANGAEGSLQQAFDDYIKNQRTWWASKDDSQRLFLVAKQRSLNRIIATFPDVATASVEVSEPARIGLRRAAPAKAAVAITSVNRKPISMATVEQIRNLRALDEDFGDRLKKLCAYAFQHASKEVLVSDLLQNLGHTAFAVLSASRLGVARRPGCVLVDSGRVPLQMERAGLSFARFMRSLRRAVAPRAEARRRALRCEASLTRPHQTADGGFGRYAAVTGSTPAQMLVDSGPLGRRELAIDVQGYEWIDRRAA